MSRGTIDDFCTQVCRRVRFWPDHKASLWRPPT